MLEKIVQDKNVISVYKYGSQVYGKRNKKSDKDYIVIVEDKAYSEEQIEYKEKHFNIYKKSVWEDMKIENNIVVLECMSLKDKDILKGKREIIELDIIKVRQEISSISSNAFIKCKKKLEPGVDYSPYIAKKSLWHSIRVLMFGVQLVKHGMIVDFGEANKYYDEIVLNDNNEWDYYNTRWKKEYNSLRSQFRKETEKEWKEYKGLLIKGLK